MIPYLKDLFDSTGNIFISRANGFYFNVYVMERMANGIPINILYIDKGEIKRQKYTDIDPIPFMKIGINNIDSFLPELLDSLIEFGIKPKKSIIQPEEKSALERHLSDMRKIVSKKIGVEL